MTHQVTSVGEALASPASPIVAKSSQGFMPLAEAAEFAGVSVRTLKRWIALGLRRHQAAPRAKVLLRASDIEAFLMTRQAPQINVNALVAELQSDLRPKTA